MPLGHLWFARTDTRRETNGRTEQDINDLLGQA
jgi:hypothetical protein